MALPLSQRGSNPGIAHDVDNVLRCLLDDGGFLVCGILDVDRGETTSHPDDILAPGMAGDGFGDLLQGAQRHGEALRRSGTSLAASHQAPRVLGEVILERSQYRLAV